MSPGAARKNASFISLLFSSAQHLPTKYLKTAVRLLSHRRIRLKGLDPAYFIINRRKRETTECLLKRDIWLGSCCDLQRSAPAVRQQRSSLSLCRTGLMNEALGQIFIRKFFRRKSLLRCLNNLIRKMPAD